MKAPVIVLKFGSSVLRTARDLPDVVHEIYRYLRDGFGVVAVVSAFEGVTHRLLETGRDLGADPEHGVGLGGLAALAAAGERESAAALQITLSRAGLPASLADPLAVRLRVEGNGLEGRPVGVDTSRLLELLARGRVVIVPGFFGSHEDEGISLLGRGGSDGTALFLAQSLGARCRLLKDTDGIYEHDPNRGGESPLPYEYLGYEEALRLRAPVVQEAALRFAEAHGQLFEVARLGSTLGTTVGPGPSRTARSMEAGSAPLRVTLLGLGTVGGGVYERLRELPDRFEIAAIAVRDRERHRAAGVPGERLHSLDQALEKPADVVIEAIGGVAEAGEALARSLRAGRHVITANKAVMAARGEELRAMATREGVTLSFSAAVGGVVPVIETLRGLPGPVARIEGVLNGTTNFVLDRLADGVSLDEAVNEARSLGYAEADPGDDLSGLDAARKLALVAREALGVTLPAEEIPRPGFDALERWPLQGHRALGRMVAVAEAREEGCTASVNLIGVDAGSPLAGCRGADNMVLITLADGSTVERRGRGAGRWPTTESVMGDLLQLERELRPRPRSSRKLLGEFEARAS